ncbi:DUF4136 domain-containing protein [Ramlibacter henchirensis]|uniref:DUF4136 domain-containing protein n=1 Tax=Ramlibacter henchirensis TaxID=204072 RepID=A0A4Z0CB07_9BURK|nr:DUF4136 domain-containing protein [Ramlibacter henchirensis]TFZ07259.1 DUF4136 domain-containing protein [Ramlibacter henchirensis]
MKRSFLRSVALAALAAIALVLSGCSGRYLLENNVQSFSGIPQLPTNPTYTFERLPSQANQPAQTQLEALADPALFRAGLRRDDGAPRYAVQVSARVLRVLSPWADPYDPWGWGWGGWGPGFHRGRHIGLGMGWGGPFWPRSEQPWYQREVGVIVRDKSTNQIVYESRAASDGPWLDNSVVLPAMFDAALQGFPNPPQGVRRVNIQIGGETKQAAAPAAAQPAPTPAAAPAAAPTR